MQQQLHTISQSVHRSTCPATWLPSSMKLNGPYCTRWNQKKLDKLGGTKSGVVPAMWGSCVHTSTVAVFGIPGPTFLVLFCLLSIFFGSKPFINHTITCRVLPCFRCVRGQVRRSRSIYGILFKIPRGHARVKLPFGVPACVLEEGGG